jgi:hypothetical protein
MSYTTVYYEIVAPRHAEMLHGIDVTCQLIYTALYCTVSSLHYIYSYYLYVKGKHLNLISSFHT